jgi:hypothetical protein
MKPQQLQQRRRTGNVAQLPRAIRDQVNRMLDDGCRFKAIIAWLDQNDHPGINAKQLTRWRTGGYQEWLEENRQLAREEKVLALSHQIATANEDSKAHEAAIRIATNFLFQVFLKFDPDKLATELDMKPTQITSVLNAFSRISRRSNELDVLKDEKRQQAEQRKAAAEKALLPAVPPGLSDEARERIERDYNL